MFTLTSQDWHGVVVAGTLPTSFIQTGRVYDLSGLSPTAAEKSLPDSH